MVGFLPSGLSNVKTKSDNDGDLPRPGDVIKDKYAVVRTIGQGGMGVVYEGQHLGLDQRVAIKVLLRNEVAELMTRFQREARAAGQLRGANVARVMDVDVLPSGRPFMVMEYLDGRNLGQELAARGPLPVGEVVDYVLEGCAAMAEAHQLGIVHRDLKPENLFLANEQGVRRVKVLDFGISRVPVADEARVTVTKSSLGTPLYMSPEQIRSAKRADARSDIWSLGVILYELLCGTPPFEGESPTAVVAAITVDKPRPLNERAPELPQALSDAVMRCLLKDPDARFQTIDDLAEAILPFAEHGFWGPVGRPSFTDLGNELVRSDSDTELAASDDTGADAEPEQQKPPQQEQDDRRPVSAKTDDGTWRQLPSKRAGNAGSTRRILVVLAAAAVALSIAGVQALRSRSTPPPAESPSETAAGSAESAPAQSVATTNAAPVSAQGRSAPTASAVATQTASALAATSATDASPPTNSVAASAKPSIKKTTPRVTKSRSTAADPNPLHL